MCGLLELPIRAATVVAGAALVIIALPLVICLRACDAIDTEADVAAP